MYSDSNAATNSRPVNSVSYTRNRAKITNVQVIKDKHMGGISYLGKKLFYFTFFRIIAKKIETITLPLPQQHHQQLKLL